MEKIYAVTVYSDYDPITFKAHFIRRENAMKYARKIAQKEHEEYPDSKLNEYGNSFCIICNGLSSIWINVVDLQLYDAKKIGGEA